MGRLVKYILWIGAACIGLFAVAAIALYLFFDANDFREDISQSVKSETGRDLVIEGDIKLDLFPWLAVAVGKTTLGDAPGYSDEPLLSFDSASFSVQLLPLILRQEILVGAADIDGLQVNLKVNESGRANWSDLIEEEKAGSVETDTDDVAPGAINIDSIKVSNSALRYRNDESNETVVLEDVNLRVGKLQDDGTDVPVSASLKFSANPGGLGGDLSLESLVAFDADTAVLNLGDLQLDGTIEGVASIPTTLRIRTDGIEVATNQYQVSMQPLEVAMLDMQIAADVQPFSYEDRVEPKATIRIDTFSPKAVMQLFDVEPPVTADANALTRVTVDANAELTTTTIDLSNVAIKLDDTSFSGSLSVPRGNTGAYRFDLVGDAIDLARYMEPADPDAAESDAETVATEIPVDIIRPLNARGSFKLAKASLGQMKFENIELGLNSSQGKLRLNPITAELFGGSYNGDVRIDVSGATPVLSVNERISDVDIASLVKAMFDQDNVTGTVNGIFTFSGRGADSAAIQRSLSGDMALGLSDGSYVGKDVWYELRRARALLRRETPPEPVLPAKTDFSAVQMTGVMKNGILQSDDLFAELPFMQLTGAGQIDITEATLDYRMSARFLSNPEFRSNATPEELDDFTEAVVPLRMTGPITSPSVKPDIEKLLTKQVEEEIKDKLKDKLKGLFDR